MVDSSSEVRPDEEGQAAFLGIPWAAARNVKCYLVDAAKIVKQLRNQFVKMGEGKG